MRKILSEGFFMREGETVARELLGKFLVRRMGRKEIALQINEVELYEGLEDRASHGFKRTKRSEVMYGAGGHWYVYLCYGMYEMLNIVIGPKEHPAAILIRGATAPERRIDGPGKLTKALRIGRRLNAKPANKKTGLWIEDRGMLMRKKDFLLMPRIGIGCAGAKWARRLHRFVLARN